MNNYVIKVTNLTKEYVLKPQNRYKTLRDTISELPRNLFKRKKIDPNNRFYALKNISFNVEQGDALGIIGANGAGKSTLLKILARIVTPTEGTAEITGKMATMLEVGTGFNPELTGRENVYLNGSIIGMKKKEIDTKFKTIVDFSEIEKFIDIPVKKYSSGMQVRLAFSIASHLDPEVLLLDEILAVGDLAFQRKSLLKMHDIVKNQGRTVLFVSHNMSAIETLCNKALLLENGRAVAYGDTKDVISKYVKGVYKDIKTTFSNKKHSGNEDIRITGFWIENSIGHKIKSPKSGDLCRFVFQYEIPSKTYLKDVDIGFIIHTISGQPIISHYASYNKQQKNISKKIGLITFQFDKFPLTEGRYRLLVHALVDRKEADFIDNATEINVSSGDFFNTGVKINQKISSMYVEGNWNYDQTK